MPHFTSLRNALRAIAAPLFLTCLMHTAAFAQEPAARYAVTKFSVCNLREAPDYAAELGTQALMGTVVEITGEDVYWRQVRTPEPYVAWCTEFCLREMTLQELGDYFLAPKYICTAWHSTVYATASCKADKLTDIVEGDILRIALRDAGLRGMLPVVKKGFAAVILPDGRTGYVPQGDVQEHRKWSASRKLTAENIISEAKKFIGVPYLWGGASPNGVDCSGLVRLVWMMNGASLPRNASQQAKTGEIVPVECDFSAFPPGEKPEETEEFRQEMLCRTRNLQPGDLIFFGTPAMEGKSEKVTHVGIYIGNGSFLHSSQVVRINSLIPGEDLYYSNSFRLFKARRHL